MGPFWATFWGPFLTPFLPKIAPVKGRLARKGGPKWAQNGPKNGPKKGHFGVPEPLKYPLFEHFLGPFLGFSRGTRVKCTFAFSH